MSLAHCGQYERDLPPPLPARNGRCCGLRKRANQAGQRDLTRGAPHWQKIACFTPSESPQTSCYCPISGLCYLLAAASSPLPPSSSPFLTLCAVLFVIPSRASYHQSWSYQASILASFSSLRLDTERHNERRASPEIRDPPASRWVRLTLRAEGHDCANRIPTARSLTRRQTPVRLPSTPLPCVPTAPNCLIKTRN